MGAIFKSNRNEFTKKHNAFLDMAQGHMAMDIEIFIKTSAGTPVKTGGMKAEVRHFKAAHGSWRVEAGKEYSAVQEAGIRLTGPGAPTQPFSHYTMAGTSAGWFHRAIEQVVNHRDNYIKEAAEAVGL